MTKVAVVLGNRMNDDGTISAFTRERLEYLKRYYAAEKPDFVILSGGVANPKAGISEAGAMLKALDGAIDSDRIVLEEQSKTTAENAKYSAPIIAKLKADEATIISSPYHIERKYLNPLKLFKKHLLKVGAGKVKLGAYCG